MSYNKYRHNQVLKYKKKYIYKQKSVNDLQIYGNLDLQNSYYILSNGQDNCNRSLNKKENNSCMHFTPAINCSHKIILYRTGEKCQKYIFYFVRKTTVIPNPPKSRFSSLNPGLLFLNFCASPGCRKFS